MNPFQSTRHMPSFDANAITDTIERALASAGIDTRSGPMHDVTETIRRAMASANPSQAATSGATHSAAPDDTVIDVTARFVDATDDETDASAAPQPTPTPQSAPTAGALQKLHYSNHAGARPYGLYVPTTPHDGPRPMVVMLHGCTQSADDFAAGTQMNRLADQHGFIVVYPEQTAQANPSRCWNWFNPRDQRRDAGEPALIAGIVRQVAARHGADPRRIYVAGLSAGAAMAVILGETYPELFAAVGAHSGLPYASAHDIASAMAAMKGGRSGMPGLKGMPDAAAAPMRPAVHAVPTIVFHGDRDHTVQHSNGDHIVRQVEAAHRTQASTPALATNSQQGTAAGGRRHTRTVHADANGRPHIESWTLHGAGHAWSGGSTNGTYTDAKGPDASAEMLRFFMAQPHTRPA